MKFSLRLNADDTYGTVKQHLSQRCGIPSYLLKLVQIAGSNIKVRCYKLANVTRVEERRLMLKIAFF